MAKRKPDIRGAVKALDEWFAKHPLTKAELRAQERKRKKREEARRRKLYIDPASLHEPVTI